jgi:hypothetical protein
LPHLAPPCLFTHCQQCALTCGFGSRIVIGLTDVQPRNVLVVPRDTSGRRARAPSVRLPIWRIGITGGVVGILCCVGPTALALFGIVSAGTAFVWANDLYDNYAWWFRLGGLAVLGVLVWIALRRRNACTISGVRRLRWRLVGVLAIAAGTYVALYALTTWLGTFAELRTVIRRSERRRPTPRR